MTWSFPAVSRHFLYKSNLVSLFTLSIFPTTWSQYVCGWSVYLHNWYLSSSSGHPIVRPTKSLKVDQYVPRIASLWLKLWNDKNALQLKARKHVLLPVHQMEDWWGSVFTVNNLIPKPCNSWTFIFAPFLHVYGWPYDRMDDFRLDFQSMEWI